MWFRVCLHRRRRLRRASQCFNLNSDGNLTIARLKRTPFPALFIPHRLDHDRPSVGVSTLKVVRRTATPSRCKRRLAASINSRFVGSTYGKRPGKCGCRTPSPSSLLMTAPVSTRMPTSPCTLPIPSQQSVRSPSEGTCLRSIISTANQPAFGALPRRMAAVTSLRLRTHGFTRHSR